jgi:hypothetical protein
MKNTFKITTLAFFLIFCLAALPATADNDGAGNSTTRYGLQRLGRSYYNEKNGPPDANRTPHPPREAIEACSTKSAGDKVEFETPRGDIISGTCTKMNELLFAVPEGGPPPEHRFRKRLNQ